MRTREQAVAIALTWKGTPYVLGGRVKGAGCDCATLLAEYLIEIGAATREELGIYSHDWFQHASEDRYKLSTLRHARLTMESICRGTPAAERANVVLFKVAGSRLYNHGAIILKWPRVLHSYDEGVSETDATTHALTGFSEMAIFDPFSEGN